MTQQTTPNKRDHFIDYFRGIIIVDMILVHFTRYFPYAIRKVIICSDVAIEGFIFLAGYMIGNLYLKKFMVDRKKTTKRLLQRAFQIVCIHYLMIITISVPYYATFRMDSSDDLVKFVARSLLFLNQIGILHILPTFIPLFIISPIILALLAKNYDYLVLLVSLVCFLVGCWAPYILNLGDKTIFPTILWQIYFVLGCIMGKKYQNREIVQPKKDKTYLFAVTIFGCIFLLNHGGFFFSDIREIIVRYNISFNKFPLNLYGFLYGSSLLFAIYSFSARFWPLISRSFLFGKIIPLFGRNSLLAFVIHAYFVYFVSAINRLLAPNEVAIYGLILSGLVIMLGIIHYTEEINSKRTQISLS